MSRNVRKRTFLHVRLIGLKGKNLHPGEANSFLYTAFKKGTNNFDSVVSLKILLIPFKV